MNNLIKTKLRTFPHTKRKMLSKLTVWTIALLLLFSLYPFVAKLAALRGIDYRNLFYTPIDRIMPFTPLFLPFYLLTFILPLAIWLYIASFQRKFKIVNITAWGIVGAISTTYVFNYLFPVYTNATIYANQISQHEMFGKYWYFLCTSIPLWNSFPSLHATLGWLSYRYYSTFIKKYLAIYSLWLIGMLIATLTLKFHLFLDILSGILVAEFFYRLAMERCEFFMQDQIY